jgi:mannosyl-glycoprotein endo-beta-N-acetylglucosaminidase
VDVGDDSGTGWERHTLDLSPYAGRTISQLALQVDGTDPAYDLRVGQVAVHDGAMETPAAPSGLTVLGASDVTAGVSQSLRLSWTAAPGGNVHHYEVYRRNADGSRTFLGATPNDAYFVGKLDRAGTEATTTLDVEAVSTTYGRSTAASTTVSWTGTPPTSTNLALNRPATASGQCNANEGPAKAVNGSVSGGNSDKWCTLTSSKWLEVDLGSAKKLNRFVVEHAQAGGESASYDTRDFSIQIRSNTTDPWTTVATVTGNTAGTTTHPVNTTARYVRLVVTKPTQTTDPAARIYEFEAWGA